MGADVVVAIDVGAPPTEIGEDADVLTVVRRMTDFMMASGNRSFAQPPDVHVRPDFEGIDSGDYELFEETIERGRAAARCALDQIEPLLCGRRGAPRAAETESGSGSRGAHPQGRVPWPQAGQREPGEAPAAARGGSALRPRDRAAPARRGLGEQPVLLRLARGQARPARALSTSPSPSGRGPPFAPASGVSYNEADNVRGTLRLRNGNLLGLGERLDARFVADAGRTELRRLHGQCQPRGLPVWLPPGPAGRRGQAARLRCLRAELGRATFRQLRFLAAGQRAIGNDGLLELGLSGGWTEVLERAGIPFAAETDTRGQGRGAPGHSTPSTTASGRGAGCAWTGGRSSRFTALGATRSYWRASLRADAFTRLGKRLDPGDTAVRRRGPGRPGPRLRPTPRGRAAARSRPQPRRDVGELGGGRLARDLPPPFVALAE